jgi:hypothetical protein
MNSTNGSTDSSEFPMKDLVLPPSTLEIIGIFVLMIMTLLLNVGGLGGGGTLTPFMHVFFGL